MTEILDFYATWCGPCRLLTPVLEEVTKELNLPLQKINVDEQPKMATAYNIRSLPTIVVLQDGAEVSRIVGGRSKQQLLNLLKPDEPAKIDTH